MTTIGAFAAVFDEDERLLFVRRAYAPHNWTLPGGRVDPGESPVAAAAREVREETGFVVEPGELIGVYAAPFKDDLVLLFACRIVSREAWSPDGEIAEVAFRAAGDTPPSLRPRTAARVADAFAGVRGVVRVFAEESDAGEAL